TYFIMAVDAYNNRAPSYLGTVHFTSSDANATLPANYTFTAADAGKHFFTAVMATTGVQTLAVVDTTNAKMYRIYSITVLAATSSPGIVTTLSATLLDPALTATLPPDTTPMSVFERRK